MQQAIERIQGQIDRLEDCTDHEFVAWRHRTLGIVEDVFGLDSRQAENLKSLKPRMSLTELYDAAHNDGDRRRIVTKEPFVAMLDAFIDEIRESGQLDRTPTPPENQSMLEDDAPGHGKIDSLLLLLSESAKGVGLPLEDLPQEICDPDLLTVCDADGLIEFGARNHCFVGPSKELRVEEGWSFSSVTGPNKEPMSQFIEEELSSDKPPSIRMHVRLTSNGRTAASRLRLRSGDESNASVEEPAAPVPKTPAPFEGGVMTFYFDRVELCGVVICDSGKKSRTRRKILEALSKKDADGAYVAYSGEKLAERVQLGSDDCAGPIRDLRDGISKTLLSAKNIECGRMDAILSGGPGYRFADCISVKTAQTRIGDKDPNEDAPDNKQRRP